ncbi:hypothetical protein D9M72_370970 [compost metagenome]
MMPASMEAAMTPSRSRVVAAFLLFGFWKLGTPLLMASTPVRAAAPEENARSNRNAPASPTRPSSNPAAGTIVKSADGAFPNWPVRAWKTPTAVIPRMEAMKMYVGTAKTLPASLMPRRFTNAKMMTPTVAINACWPCSAGTAVVR